MLLSKTCASILFIFLCGLFLIGPLRAADEAIEERAQGRAAFALELLKRLAEEAAQDENLVFSPQGLSQALAMAWAGARGDTARQMAEVLRLGTAEPNAPAVFDPAAGDHVAAASALWVQRGRGIAKEYLDKILDRFGGEASEVDFRARPDEARGVINAWFDSKTGGKVAEMLLAEDVTPSLEVLLTQAVHFREDWAYRFDPTNTKECPFHVTEQTTVAVPLMYQRCPVGYAYLRELEVARIPFADGEHSLVIVLPSDPKGLDALVRDLTPDKLRAWTDAAKEEKTGLFLPRLKVSSRLGLKETLAALGMGDAFSKARADFSGITGEQGLFIDEVIHQASLDLFEEGAEALSGSAVLMKKGGALFRADRPFLFFIESRALGDWLLLGMVKNPAKP